MAIASYPADNALTIYAKPLPLETADWANDAVAFAAVGSLDVHQGDVDDAKDYYVFLQAGESPASTDVIDGAIGKDQATAVLAAATDAGGMPANVKWANDKPLEPVTDIAKESSVQQAITAINGIEPGGGGSSPTGPGGISVIIPVTLNNQPVDGVAVWITTDPEGTNQIAGTLYTNTFGNTNPPFTLEPGIFYVWVQKAGINFINPQPVQVLENGTYQWYTG